MEKRILWLLSFLVGSLYIPFVTAQITLNGISLPSYNLGDEVTLSGEITSDRDLVGLFTLTLRCTSEQQLFARTYHLLPTTPIDYTETVPFLDYLSGQCVVAATLTESGTVVGDILSPSFTLTQDLNGQFTLDKTIAKLGDHVTVAGIVSRINGDPVDGTATVYFKQNDSDVFIDAVKIDDGQFTASFDTSYAPSGSYIIEARVSDLFGNQQTFLLDPLTLLSSVDVSLHADDFHVLPGKSIRVDGEAMLLGQPLSSGRVTLTLGDSRIEQIITDGTFSLKMPLSSTIPSGKKDILAVVTDDHGNSGSSTLTFIVDPVPTTLEVRSSANSYKPGNIISFTPVLLDQAGAPLTADVEISLSAPDYTDAYADLVPSNVAMEFKLLSTALPGIWKIAAFSSGLEHVYSFDVLEQSALQVSLSDEVLVFLNTGNVAYRGPVTIELQSFSDTSTLVKDLSLEVNETYDVDLRSEVAPGTYTVVIGGSVFPDVVISGGRPFSFLWIIWTIITLILLFLLLRFMRRTKSINLPVRPLKKLTFIRRELPVSHPKEKVLDEKFKRQLERNYSFSKKPVKFSFLKKRDDNMYAYDLPKKRERAPDATPPASSYSDYSSSYESSTTKTSDEKPKKGLFDMFD